jgi:hypothetical protein
MKICFFVTVEMREFKKGRPWKKYTKPVTGWAAKSKR